MFILIISDYRSGTNYTRFLIKQTFRNVESNGEIFCNRNELILNYMIESQTFLHLLNINNIKNDKLAYVNLANVYKVKGKIQLVKDMCSVDNKKIQIFKIFACHINDDELSEIIKLSTMCVFIYRNYVDRYISQQKALIVKRWTHTNTSKVLINFNIDDYNSLKKQSEKYFDFAMNECVKYNKKISMIDYELFFKLSLNEQQLFWQNEILKNAFPDVQFKIYKIYNLLEKQDNEKDIGKKIKNYDQVKDFIKTEYDIYYKKKFGIEYSNI